MPEQHEIINDMMQEIHRMFYEAPEYGTCELCGTYDKFAKGEKWCIECDEVIDNEA